MAGFCFTSPPENSLGHLVNRISTGCGVPHGSDGQLGKHFAKSNITNTSDGSQMERREGSLWSCLF